MRGRKFCCVCGISAVFLCIEEISLSISSRTPKIAASIPFKADSA